MRVANVTLKNISRMSINIEQTFGSKHIYLYSLLLVYFLNKYFLNPPLRKRIFAKAKTKTCFQRLFLRTIFFIFSLSEIEGQKIFDLEFFFRLTLR